MKNPQSLFPFLYASSWIGNLLLTGLAVYLALSHSGPLTPLVFTAMAVCIFSGTLLPAAVYLLQLWWFKAWQAGESLEADLLLREGLRRSEEVLGRLDEAEGSIAKSLLLARQLPDQLARKIGAWEQLFQQYSGEDWAAISQHLELQARDLDFLKDESAAVQQKLLKLERHLQAIEVALPKGTPAREGPPRPCKAAAPAKTAELELELGLAAPAGADHATAAHPHDAVPVPHADDTGADAGPADEFGMVEVEAAAADALPAETAAAAAVTGPCTLRVQAMIGINNRLYVRGKASGLSPERGRELRLVGIGEYEWISEPTAEPIEVQLYLNDVEAALDGPVVLEPAQTVRVSGPRFN